MAIRKIVEAEMACTVLFALFVYRAGKKTGKNAIVFWSAAAMKAFDDFYDYVR